ncbi:hypothetical protein ETECTG_CDS0029 [Escherichia phage ETEC-TG]|nr:hypothetical protein [Escherichia phage pEC-M2929-1AR.1]WPK30544.1 hypothetical protein ETECTG_CDS0029 [Escherichia phage ETEC-TG]
MIILTMMCAAVIIPLITLIVSEIDDLLFERSLKK